MPIDKGDIPSVAYTSFSVECDDIWSDDKDLKRKKNKGLKHRQITRLILFTRIWYGILIELDAFILQV